MISKKQFLSLVILAFGLSVCFGSCASSKKSAANCGCAAKKPIG